MPRSPCIMSNTPMRRANTRIIRDALIRLTRTRSKLCAFKEAFFAPNPACVCGGGEENRPHAGDFSGSPEARQTEIALGGAG